MALQSDSKKDDEEVIVSPDDAEQIKKAAELKKKAIVPQTQSQAPPEAPPVLPQYTPDATYQQPTDNTPKPAISTPAATPKDASALGEDVPPPLPLGLDDILAKVPGVDFDAILPGNYQLPVNVKEYSGNIYITIKQTKDQVKVDKVNDRYDASGNKIKDASYNSQLNMILEQYKKAKAKPGQEPKPSDAKPAADSADADDKYQLPAKGKEISLEAKLAFITVKGRLGNVDDKYVVWTPGIPGNTYATVKVKDGKAMYLSEDGLEVAFADKAVREHLDVLVQPYLSKLEAITAGTKAPAAKKADAFNVEYRSGLLETGYFVVTDADGRNEQTVVMRQEGPSKIKIDTTEYPVTLMDKKTRKPVTQEVYDSLPQDKLVEIYKAKYL